MKAPLPPTTEQPEILRWRAIDTKAYARSGVRVQLRRAGVLGPRSRVAVFAKQTALETAVEDRSSRSIASGPGRFSASLTKSLRLESIARSLHPCPAGLFLALIERQCGAVRTFGLQIADDVYDRGVRCSTT